MLPMSPRRVFKNRWWTLVFAAGICWTAVEVAEEAPKNPVDANSSADDTRTVAGLLANM